MQSAGDDIEFMEMQISMEEIKTDGYQKKLTQRPIKQAIVDDLKRSYTGISKEIPIVVFSTEDGLYHVIKCQHYVEALNQLINEGKIEPLKEITCNIISRISTCEVLDANVTQDRLICNEYRQILKLQSIKNMLLKIKK